MMDESISKALILLKIEAIVFMGLFDHSSGACLSDVLSAQGVWFYVLALLKKTVILYGKNRTIFLSNAVLVLLKKTPFF